MGRCKHIKRWMNRLIDTAAMMCLLLTIWVVVKVTTFASFSIPSDSMEPSLQPGDLIMVNKWLLGARLFDVCSAVEGKRVHIQRLPGLGQLKRNDVVVFNFPYINQWDSIQINMHRYYVKRCVALPNDTIEIRHSHFYVRGFNYPLGNVASQDNLEKMFQNRGDIPRELCIKAFPLDSMTEWTIREFGPLKIPHHGYQVKLDKLSISLYRKLMEWETGRHITCKDGKILLGDSVVTDYTFCKDYCFVAGDRTENSQDSRYWGMLPIEFIVGKATRILWAHDSQTHRIRWERIWKIIE